MNRITVLSIIVVFAVVLSGCAAAPIIVLTPQSGSVQLSTGLVNTHPMRGDVSLVPGASTALVTNSDEARFVYNATDLVPGNVYTAWWVVVNDPQACEAEPCTASDILERTDAVQAEITYGDGQIADELGRATLTGSLPAGDLPNGWFGHGMHNPRTAEIRIVLHDHGPAIEGMVDEMLTTFRAACTDDSLPTVYPDVAYADGAPGPNTCVHYQFSIFQQ